MGVGSFTSLSKQHLACAGKAGRIGKLTEQMLGRFHIGTGL
jgi:hypothetical protein